MESQKLCLMTRLESTFALTDSRCAVYSSSQILFIKVNFPKPAFTCIQRCGSGLSSQLAKLPLELSHVESRIQAKVPSL